MKNVLKITFFAAFFALIACGETATQKEETVASAAATAKTMVEEKAKEVMDKAEMVKDEMVKEGAEKAEMVKEGMEDAKSMAKEGMEDAKSMAKEGMEKAKTVKDEMTKEAMEKAKTVKNKVTKSTAAAAKKANKAVTLKEKPEKIILQKESVINAAQEKATAAKEKAAAATKEAMPKAETPKVATPAPAPKKVAVPKAFSHAAWNTLAQKHISSTGKVNYKGFKADIGAFDAYLKSLADNPIQSSWSRNKKMAYWINAYNAFTIKLIVDNYPVKSITDLEGGKPWDKKWIKLGGKTYSLNNIEHDILRPQYKDARIHFAVNCAAKSCPPVWNKAWTAANLKGQLERSAKSFINNSKYNSVGGSNAAISKIFEWYAVDFGNITDYLNKYANTKVADGTAVTYQEYNWALIWLLTSFDSPFFT